MSAHQTFAAFRTYRHRLVDSASWHDRERRCARLKNYRHQDSTDADHKLIISFQLDGRDAFVAKALMGGMVTRPAFRVQMTTDGDKAYVADKSDGKSRQIFPRAVDFVGRFAPRSGGERRDRTTRT